MTAFAGALVFAYIWLIAACANKKYKADRYELRELKEILESAKDSSQEHANKKIDYVVSELRKLT